MNSIQIVLVSSILAIYTKIQIILYRYFLLLYFKSTIRKNFDIKYMYSKTRL